MKRVLFSVVVIALMAGIMTACGGKKTDNNQESEEQPTTEVAAVEATPEPEPVAQEPEKKWYEKNFTLTMTQHLGTAAITQTYARKDNIIAVKQESGTTNLFVCTDSSRIGYLINNGKYIQLSEKKGFDNADEAAFKYLKSQFGETLLGKHPKKGEDDVTTKDTTYLGHDAYHFSKKIEEKNFAATAKGKAIVVVDKKNDMVYYKWAHTEINDQVMTDGVVFEVTAFSDDPTYEGIVISLDDVEPAM